MAKLVIVSKMACEWCYYKLRAEECDLVDNASLMWITKEDWAANDEPRSRRLKNSKEVYYCTEDEYDKLTKEDIDRQCIRMTVNKSDAEFYKLVNKLIVK